VPFEASRLSRISSLLKASGAASLPLPRQLSGKPTLSPEPHLGLPEQYLVNQTKANLVYNVHVGG